MIRVKRAYDPPTASDGFRVLVDRLWPRGVRKESLQLDAWMKEIAPSTELRQWYESDTTRWDEFRRRYVAELDQNNEALLPLLERVREGDVTLISSKHDTAQNNALVLKDYLETKMRSKRR